MLDVSKWKGQDYVNFQMTGKVPRSISPPKTPLLKCIESIPVSYWDCFQHIKLGPGLGFSTGAQFTNLHQLARWLGKGQKVREGQTLPYESYCIRSVQTVSIDMLLERALKKPNDEQLTRILRCI